MVLSNGFGMLDSVLIFLMSLVLRVLAITVPLNTDEVKWISRGGAFIQNLLALDLTDTYLRHHPGVPNMWLIGSGMVLNCQLSKVFPGLFDLNLPADLSACLNPDSFPIGLFVIPRLLQAIVTSACLVGVYLLSQRLFGRGVALCATSLLMLEPFFLAYQRFITTDALQTDFSIVALLLLLLYLRGDGKRRLLGASGVFMGLAIAAKITALFVVPGVFLWIVLIESGTWQGSFPKRGWRQWRKDLRIGGLMCLGTMVVIWPALLVSPLYVIGQLFEGLSEEATRGYFFFLGQSTASPGLLFYPLVLAYRLSPLLQIGLLACGIMLLVPKLRRRLHHIPELTALAIVSFSVFLILSIATTKIDRYISVIFPELALLAAVGWLSIAAWVKNRWQKFFLGFGQAPAGTKTALLLLIGQFAIALPAIPYYITYYNPLLGGTRTAQHIFAIGQGEGLDLAARWLNQSAHAKDTVAASWHDSAFAAYFHGHTLPIPKYRQPDPQPWLPAHRLVLYQNQLQRQLPEPEMVTYFTAQPPLHIVRLDGIDYARIYPGPIPLPEDLADVQIPLTLNFGESVRLHGYDLNSAQITPGEALVTTFYWQFLAPALPADATISLSLRDGAGMVWGSAEGQLVGGYWPMEAIAPGTFLRDAHSLTVAPDTPPGRYRLAVEWFSPNGGRRLGEQVAIAEIEVE